MLALAVRQIHSLYVESAARRATQHRAFQQVSLRDLIGATIPAVYPYSYLSDGSGVLDLALLSGLARDRPGCRYLEIGTWRGESICNVARYATECVSVSLSREQAAELHGEAYAETLNHHVGNTRCALLYPETLPSREHPPFPATPETTYEVQVKVVE